MKIVSNHTHHVITTTTEVAANAMGFAMGALVLWGAAAGMTFPEGAKSALQTFNF